MQFVISLLNQLFRLSILAISCCESKLEASWFYFDDLMVNELGFEEIGLLIYDKGKNGCLAMKTVLVKKLGLIKCY